VFIRRWQSLQKWLVWCDIHRNWVCTDQARIHSGELKSSFRVLPYMYIPRRMWSLCERLFILRVPSWTTSLSCVNVPRPPKHNRCAHFHVRWWYRKTKICRAGFYLDWRFAIGGDEVSGSLRIHPRVVKPRGWIFSSATSTRFDYWFLISWDSQYSKTESRCARALCSCSRLRFQNCVGAPTSDEFGARRVVELAIMAEYLNLVDVECTASSNWCSAFSQLVRLILWCAELLGTVREIRLWFQRDNGQFASSILQFNSYRKLILYSVFQAAKILYC